MACLFPFNTMRIAVAIQNYLQLLSASCLFIDNLQDEEICRLIFPCSGILNVFFLSDTVMILFLFCSDF